MALGGGAFGGCVGREGMALVSGTSALMKEAQRAPSTTSGHSEKIVFSELGSGLSPDAKSAGAWILTFTASRIGEVSICCLSVTPSTAFCCSSTNELTPVFWLLRSPKAAGLPLWPPAQSEGIKESSGLPFTHGRPTVAH